MQGPYLTVAEIEARCANERLKNYSGKRDWRGPDSPANKLLGV